LLRSRFQERMEGLVKAVQGGVMAPNEARALEGYPAAKDGDEPRTQQQVVPLSAWSKPPPRTPRPEAPPAPEPAAAPAQTAPGTEPPEKGIDLADKLVNRVKQHADFRRAA